jgi:hypothetical protein
MLLLLLAAFGLGYCVAWCREEDRRCETWRDGVRFGATWREDLEEPKSYTAEAGQGDGRLWEVNAEPGLRAYRLDPNSGEWICRDISAESQPSASPLSYEDIARRLRELAADDASEWIHVDTAREWYTVTGTDGDPDYRGLPY